MRADESLTAESLTAESLAGTESLTDTERAVFGDATTEQLGRFLSDWADRRLGSPVERVRFRSGRIDVVWGVELADGRAVVIKIHRPPVELDDLLLAHAAQRMLVAEGFPCAEPVAGPEEFGGHVLAAETLVEGRPPDGDDPAARRLLAHGLAAQITILRRHPDLVRRAGRGPSWCRYQDGPWPVSHDTLVDLRTTPPEFGWLDELGRRAAEQIRTHREGAEIVAAHADWYAGNAAVADGVLVGTFDWELVGDTEAVVAGFAASCFGASSTGGGGLSGPAAAGAFLRDYEVARDRPFDGREQRAAAGAAAWIVAFNARWQVGLIPHGLCDDSTLALARVHGQDYLDLGR